MDIRLPSSKFFRRSDSHWAQRLCFSLVFALLGIFHVCLCGLCSVSGRLTYTYLYRTATANVKKKCMYHSASPLFHQIVRTPTTGPLRALSSMGEREFKEPLKLWSTDFRCLYGSDRLFSVFGLCASWAIVVLLYLRHMEGPTETPASACIPSFRQTCALNTVRLSALSSLRTAMRMWFKARPKYLEYGSSRTQFFFCLFSVVCFRLSDFYCIFLVSMG